MANEDSSKGAVDQAHESYGDDSKARRVLNVLDDGTPVDDSNELPIKATDLDIRDLTSVSDDVSVTTVKPDGTNTMPSLDVVGRAGFVKVTDGVASGQARLDGATEVLGVIEYPHFEIHEGGAFKADVNTNDLDSEGTNNALHISFSTPDTTKWAHLVILASATGSADLSLVEAPTGGVSGGSALTVYNRNRNSVNASVLLDTHTPGTADQLTQDATAPTGGSEIHHWKMGTGKNRIGGENRDVEEFVLKQDTKYSLRMTTAENDIRAQLTISWYEHIDLN
jgi:hypothetical protein